MDQDNNGDINSLFLNYDLSTNYLYGVQFKSLQEICILNVVVNSCESDEAVQEIRRLSLGQSQNTRNLFRIVKNSLPINQWLSRTVKEVRFTIRLVYNEIKRFLGTIGIENDKFLFLGKFVFNWQGGINPRKTVLRVLESSTLHVWRKFEFSCKYSFDEDTILGYLNILPPELQFDVANVLNPFHLPIFLIFYWKCRYLAEHFQRPHSAHLLIHISRLTQSSSFRAMKFSLSSEIGVQYTFENIPPLNVFNHEIIDLFMQECETYRINILMYLLFKLREEEILHRYAYEILTKLVKSIRWHDTFIIYFRLLRHNVETKRYLSLIYTVFKRMSPMLRNKHEKYFLIWEEFNRLIPIRENNFMEKTYGRKYAEKVFHLFTYQDLKLIYFFLTIDTEKTENDVDIGFAFYELATTYFDLFAKVYHQSSGNPEIFLRKLIKSNDQVSHLLTRLYFTSSDPFYVIHLKCILWDETQPMTDWYLNMCIIIT
ncbi:UNVERIFIED_CONTAM: hypothetical protein RMT77_011790 [Armadillidium vulgare]